MFPTLPVRALLAAGGLCLTALGAQAESARVIVRFKADAVTARMHALAAQEAPDRVVQVLRTRAQALGERSGQALTAGRALDARTQVVLAEGLSSAQLAARLARDADVELVAVDQRRHHTAVPNDAYYAPGNAALAAGQWYLRAPDSTVLSSINAPAAWDVSKGSDAIVVAVLDTGVRYDHPDLAGRLIAQGYDFVGYQYPGNAGVIASANDGNGADADASDPGDWVSQADKNAYPSAFKDCRIEDSSWHGTRVSGLIGAATQNSRGIAGVTWNNRILPVRVLGKCGGWDSDIMAGMKWAAGLPVPGVPANANPAKILNMSLGGTGSCTGTDGTGRLYRELVSQISGMNVLIVAATGNDTGKAVGLPANCTGVLGVTALRHIGTKVGFANIGPETGIAAPGGNCVNDSGPCVYAMLSTTNSGTQSPVRGDEAYTNGAASVGTSFATPIASGVAALVWSARPSLTRSEVVRLLQGNARPFPARAADSSVPLCRAPDAEPQLECHCTTSLCGAGMLDAGAAVQHAGALQSGARITASAATVGQTITLQASLPGLPPTRQLTQVQWQLSGASGVVGTLSANGATATVPALASGTFTVAVSVTDDLGFISTATQNVTVLTPPVTTVPGSGSGSGGGSSGGGALHLGWLAGLLWAAWCLRRDAGASRRPLRPD